MNIVYQPLPRLIKASNPPFIFGLLLMYAYPLCLRSVTLELATNDPKQLCWRSGDLLTACVQLRKIDSLFRAVFLVNSLSAIPEGRINSTIDSQQTVLDFESSVKHRLADMLSMGAEPCGYKGKRAGRVSGQTGWALAGK